MFRVIGYWCLAVAIVGLTTLAFVSRTSAECTWKCKVTNCAKGNSGQCYQTWPFDDCMVGYIRNGGLPGVCLPKAPVQWTSHFLCDDCNPECPQNAVGEATLCQSDCFFLRDDEVSVCGEDT